MTQDPLATQATKFNFVDILDYDSVPVTDTRAVFEDITRKMYQKHLDILKPFCDFFTDLRRYEHSAVDCFGTGIKEPACGRYMVWRTGQPGPITNGTWIRSRHPGGRCRGCHHCHDQHQVSLAVQMT